MGTEKKRIHNTPEAERPPTGSKCASDRIERAKPPPLPQPLTYYFRDRQNEQELTCLICEWKVASRRCRLRFLDKRGERLCTHKQKGKMPCTQWQNESDIKANSSRREKSVQFQKWENQRPKHKVSPPQNNKTDFSPSIDTSQKYSTPPIRLPKTYFNFWDPGPPAFSLSNSAKATVIPGNGTKASIIVAKTEKLNAQDLWKRCHFFSRLSWIKFLKIISPGVTKRTIKCFLIWCHKRKSLGKQSNDGKRCSGLFSTS